MLAKSLILAVQGAIVGTGAILPGVSGGVLLVAFGIYEPMMALLSHPKKSFLRQKPSLPWRTASASTESSSP